MKRGRPATKGIDDAVTIAQRRGCVMRVTYSPESVCDFFIRTALYVIFVRAVRFEKIILPVEEIERECREMIAELRLFPKSEQIRLELWIYSKHGTYRFFRITDAGLEEIPQEGKPGAAAPAEDAARETVSPVTGKEGEGAGSALSPPGPDSQLHVKEFPGGNSSPAPSLASHVKESPGEFSCSGSGSLSHVGERPRSEYPSRDPGTMNSPTETRRAQKPPGA